MKKFICLAMGAIVLLALSPAVFAGVDDYVGKWTNADRNTRGITALDITAQGPRTSIHAWGKCHPQDCDWGTVSARYYRDGTLRAVYTTNFAEKSLILTIEGTNTMKAEVSTHFTDNSGREDYRLVESFTRGTGGTGTSTTETKPTVVAPVTKPKIMKHPTSGTGTSTTETKPTVVASTTESRNVKQPKGEIKIISPNGGEVWAQGNRYGIRWGIR